MPESGTVSRDAIVHVLTDALRPLPCVHAFWEGGAAAFGRVDEWSDLDLYLLVEDDAVEVALGAVEAALAGLTSVRLRFPVPHPPDSGISQVFYKLEGAGDYLLIDLAVLRSSAPDKFLEPEIHGPAVFYLNRAGNLRMPALDREAFVRKAMERLGRLRDRVELFAPFVQKEIHRGNGIEAVDLYRSVVFDSLVEVLRLKHRPVHHAFRTRYVHDELPEDVVSRLESLAYVRDREDLVKKLQSALEWFHRVGGSLDESSIRNAMD